MHKTQRHLERQENSNKWNILKTKCSGFSVKFFVCVLKRLKYSVSSGVIYSDLKIAYIFVNIGVHLSF